MSYDVIIVGGAVMGAATAYHLARLDPAAEVVVLERDPTYRYSSTLLCDGNVRIQFNLPENILMSMYAMEVVETFADDFTVGDWRPEPAPRHQGNLFLVDAGSESAAREGLARQQALGCEVEWLDAVTVADRFPIYAGSGYSGGTLGVRDGSVDPSAILHGYRRKAASLGVEFRKAEVESLVVADGRVGGVRLADGAVIDAPVVVNAAGAWCTALAATAGVDLPVRPVMRSVYTVKTHLSGEVPSVFLPSGLYVIPEADGMFLVAWSQPDDPVGFDFRYERQRFEDLIWPALAEAFPAFEALHVTGGWAGLYAVNTLDGNAILGEWPELGGLFLANGFSGHGFQQGPAVGRHLAELILARTPSLDLSRFGPERILRNAPYPEHSGRII